MSVPPGANVVITGAAHGIGAALAKRYAEAGHRVAVLDLDAEAARARAAELERAGATSVGVACDVTSQDDCRAAIKSVQGAWGGVDLLVNNAGITQLGFVRDTTPEVLRRVMDVNFFGAVHCTQAALPSLLERRGRVVALSSVAGFAPLAGRAGYVASKHAVEGFFDTLRAEYLGDGLGVTLVRPSFVRTHIGDRALGVDGTAAGAGARTGVGHEIDPTAAAEAIFDGVARGRRIVWVGNEARLSWWLSQLAPRSYERLMLRRTGG
jgi:NAD(P)-dependent dehydrogenase (short-subunit alcohol dehydrogenase family)